MLSSFKNYKQQVYPIICIPLYVLFTSTDLWTTCLATPDLVLESNPVVVFFGWGWTELLIYAFCMLLITTLLAVVSNKYILYYFDDRKTKRKRNKFLFFASCLALIYCYHNLIASFEATINNYLLYIFLNQNSANGGVIQKIAVGYTEFYLRFNENLWQKAHIYFITTLIIILATLVVFFRVNSVKRYVTDFPSRNN